MCMKYEIRFNIPFPTNRLAEIAYDVLKVDDEPPRSQVTKTLSANNNLLEGVFTSESERKVQNAVYKFLDKISLINETLEAFGPPTSDQYSFS